MRLAPSALSLSNVVLAGCVLTFGTARAARAQGDSTVYEVRTYTAHEGRLADMHETFRSYWAKSIFPKHGMHGVIYLAPTDTPLARNTMIYILAHPSRAAAERSWAAFGADPEVRAIAAQRNANGRIVAQVERVYATALDFSPIRSLHEDPGGIAVAECDSALAHGPEEAAAVCRVNARWDEANLKMDYRIVEPILDEQFFWAAGENLAPKASIVRILRETDVRFEIYESDSVRVFVGRDMAHAVGISLRKVRAGPSEPAWSRVRFTRTFVRRGDRWLILSHHYTPLQQAAQD